MPRGSTCQEIIAVDNGGTIYVADTTNFTIRKITSAGVVTTFAGLASVFRSVHGVGSAARFNLPAGISVGSSGTVYVADTNNHTIRKITPAGAVSTLAGTPGASGGFDGAGPNARFNLPHGIAVATATGNRLRGGQPTTTQSGRSLQPASSARLQAFRGSPATWTLVIRCEALISSWCVDLTGPETCT